MGIESLLQLIAVVTLCCVSLAINAQSATRGGATATPTIFLDNEWFYLNATKQDVIGQFSAGSTTSAADVVNTDSEDVLFELLSPTGSAAHTFFYIDYKGQLTSKVDFASMASPPQHGAVVNILVRATHEVWTANTEFNVVALKNFGELGFNYKMMPHVDTSETVLDTSIVDFRVDGSGATMVHIGNLTGIDVLSLPSCNISGTLLPESGSEDTPIVVDVDSVKVAAIEGKQRESAVYLNVKPLPAIVDARFFSGQLTMSCSTAPDARYVEATIPLTVISSIKLAFNTDPTGMKDLAIIDTSDGASKTAFRIVAVPADSAKGRVMLPFPFGNDATNLEGFAAPLVAVFGTSTAYTLVKLNGLVIECVNVATCNDLLTHVRVEAFPTWVDENTDWSSWQRSNWDDWDYTQNHVFDVHYNVTVLDSVGMPSHWLSAEAPSNTLRQTRRPIPKMSSIFKGLNTATITEDSPGSSYFISVGNAFVDEDGDAMRYKMHSLQVDPVRKATEPIAPPNTSTLVSVGFGSGSVHAVSVLRDTPWMPLTVVVLVVDQYRALTWGTINLQWSSTFKTTYVGTGTLPPDTDAPNSENNTAPKPPSDEGNEFAQQSTERNIAILSAISALIVVIIITTYVLRSNIYNCFRRKTFFWEYTPVDLWDGAPFRPCSKPRVHLIQSLAKRKKHSPFQHIERSLSEKQHVTDSAFVELPLCFPQQISLWMGRLVGCRVVVDGKRFVVISETYCDDSDGSGDNNNGTPQQKAQDHPSSKSQRPVLSPRSQWKIRAQEILGSRTIESDRRKELKAKLASKRAAALASSQSNSNTPNTSTQSPLPSPYQSGCEGGSSGTATPVRKKLSKKEKKMRKIKGLGGGSEARIGVSDSELEESALSMSCESFSPLYSPQDQADQQPNLTSPISSFRLPPSFASQSPAESLNGSTQLQGAPPELGEIIDISMQKRNLPGVIFLPPLHTLPAEEIKKVILYELVPTSSRAAGCIARKWRLSCQGLPEGYRRVMVKGQLPEWIEFDATSGMLLFSKAKVPLTKRKAKFRLQVMEHNGRCFQEIPFDFDELYRADFEECGETRVVNGAIVQVQTEEFEAGRSKKGRGATKRVTFNLNTSLTGANGSGSRAESENHGRVQHGLEAPLPAPPTVVMDSNFRLGDTVPPEPKAGVRAKDDSVLHRKQRRQYTEGPRSHEPLPTPQWLEQEASRRASANAEAKRYLSTHPQQQQQPQTLPRQGAPQPPPEVLTHPGEKRQAIRRKKGSPQKERPVSPDVAERLQEQERIITRLVEHHTQMEERHALERTQWSQERESLTESIRHSANVSLNGTQGHAALMGQQSMNFSFTEDGDDPTTGKMQAFSSVSNSPRMTTRSNSPPPNSSFVQFELPTPPRSLAGSPAFKEDGSSVHFGISPTDPDRSPSHRQQGTPSEAAVAVAQQIVGSFSLTAEPNVEYVLVQRSPGHSRRGSLSVQSRTSMDALDEGSSQPGSANNRRRAHRPTPQQQEEASREGGIELGAIVLSRSISEPPNAEHAAPDELDGVNHQTVMDEDCVFDGAQSEEDTSV